MNNALMVALPAGLGGGILAATAGLQGLAGGNIAGALAGASAPELAHIIGHESGLSSDAALVAHAILGGVAATLQGNSAAAGAAGAVSGELAAKAIAARLYPHAKEMSDLTEKEKQTVSMLATMSAGLAGGLAGDSTVSAGTGALAGKNAVENNSLAGNQAREAAKQAAESLKNQVREKLGEGTTSAIANAIINGLADTGDAALGSLDYAADGAMALASCAAGDSYCSKAMSDLAGKNRAVADTVTTLMQSETWSAVAETVKQAALEATGGLLASIMLPGKKLPGSGASIISDSVAFNTKQLDKKFKHAIDFDIITTKKNPDTLKQYETAIKNHLNDKSTSENGPYGFVKDS